jgi:hypothetical protein
MDFDVKTLKIPSCMGIEIPTSMHANRHHVAQRAVYSAQHVVIPPHSVVRVPARVQATLPEDRDCMFEGRHHQAAFYSHLVDANFAWVQAVNDTWSVTCSRKKRRCLKRRYALGGRPPFSQTTFEFFDLPAVGKEICIMWNRVLWIEHKLGTMPMADLEARWARWRKMYNSLSGYFEIPCLREQGPSFYRPLHYLVAAIWGADKPEHEISAILSAIGDFKSTVRMFRQRRLCEDQEVRGRGREWLRSIGRRAHKSLSPRKRTCHSTSVSC